MNQGWDWMNESGVRLNEWDWTREIERMRLNEWDFGWMRLNEWDFGWMRLSEWNWVNDTECVRPNVRTVYACVSELNKGRKEWGNEERGSEGASEGMNWYLSPWGKSSTFNYLLRVIPTVKNYSDIVSGKAFGGIYTACLFWFLQHMFWGSTSHSIWHLFWHTCILSGILPCMFSSIHSSFFCLQSAIFSDVFSSILFGI